jgi:tetratricopeptide (TPR) repeat protein
MLPDQSHMNMVKNALWASNGGRASVMIGAGFSRNASKKTVSAKDFPLWHEITSTLCSLLYPHVDEFKSALHQASGTSGFLKLAQEYKVGFGRDALVSLINKLVPDDDYVPGDLHRRLVRLPWQDIFTTNWDTLIERSGSSAPDRTYSTILSSDQLVSSARPRIVKLHGTLNSNTEIIFTEEDYRRYPYNYAPFVNTVQQSMMENIFLLLGFSGDDPNFLHWTGWVRDNLGENTPKIYLAGWLNLSPHKRRMLEDRNVVPIDLSKHPKAMKWPESKRHAYSVEWVLRSLEIGRPYKQEQWPTPSQPQNVNIADYLQPIEVYSAREPLLETLYPNSENVEQAISAVKATIDKWLANRTIYPGWIVPGQKVRSKIERATRNWLPHIVADARSASPEVRLSWLNIVFWRNRISLTKTFDELLQMAVATLIEFDLDQRTISGDIQGGANWLLIRKEWLEVGLDVLSEFRLLGRYEEFDKMLALILPYREDGAWVSQRLHYEECMAHVSNFDYEAVGKNLKIWTPDDEDPFWLAKKAAVLSELDRIDEARSLVSKALASIRSLGSSHLDFAVESREAWILWQAHVHQARDEDDAPDDVLVRLEELSGGYDTRLEKEDIIRGVVQNFPAKKKRSFDLNFQEANPLSPEVRYDLTRAESAIRLADACALPPYVGHFILGADLLCVAATALCEDDYVRSLRLALRGAWDFQDEAFQNVWSRHYLASLTQPHVDELRVAIEGAISYLSKSSLGPTDIRSTLRLGVFYEALSRLTLREKPANAREAFDKAIAIYQSFDKKSSKELVTPLNNLVLRSWEAMPAPARQTYFFEIMQSPFRTSQESEVFAIIDLGELLLDDAEIVVPPMSVENEQSWLRTFDFLTNGLMTTGSVRLDALVRLARLADCVDPPISYPSKVIDALWLKIEKSQFPDLGDLFDWVIMMLPQHPNSPNLGEMLFREKWLSASELNGKMALETLINVGRAIEGLEGLGREFVLSDEEKTYLVQCVNLWVSNNLTSSVRNVAGLHMLGRVLAQIHIENDANRIYLAATAKVRAPWKFYPLLPALLTTRPSFLTDVTQIVHMSIAGDRPYEAEAGLRALVSWMALSDRCSDHPKVPDELLGELSLIIAARRGVALAFALEVANYIYKQGNKHYIALIEENCIYGLGKMSSELAYDSSQTGGFHTVKPLLRSRCARLAASIAVTGKNSFELSRWATIVENDPLPEVRNTKRTGLDIMSSASDVISTNISDFDDC